MSAASSIDQPALPVARRGLLTFLAVSSTTLITVDATIANVALPNIQASLSASPDTIAWVLTSYLIAAAVATPAMGWLNDLVGRRALVLGTLTGFTVASTLCGLSTNLQQLVLFRTLQGTFGCFIVPLSQAILLDIYPRAQRGKAMGYFSMTQMGPIFGPILGGMITDSLSWHWVFFINIPIGILSFAGFWLSLPATPHAPRRIDLFGYGLLALWASALQLVLDRGQLLDWLDSIEIRTEIIISIIAFLTLIAHVVSGRDTIPDRRLLVNRSFMMGVLLVGFHGGYATIIATLPPSMLQHVFNYTAAAAGYAMAPRAIGAMIGSFGAGRLVSIFDPRLVMMTGFALNAVSFFMMAGFSPDMGFSPLIATGLIQGIAGGLCYVGIVTVAFSSIDPSMTAEASGMLSFMRNVCGAGFVAVMMSLLSRNTQVNHAELAGEIPSSMLETLGRTLHLHGSLPIHILDVEINRQALMLAYNNDFVLLGIISLVAIPFVALMRWRRLTASPAH